MDLKEVFCYPQESVLCSIGYGSGDIIKTSKCVLMTELEKNPNGVD